MKRERENRRLGDEHKRDGRRKKRKPLKKNGLKNLISSILVSKIWTVTGAIRGGWEWMWDVVAAARC